jgi:hypothetical protein
MEYFSIFFCFVVVVYELSHVLPRQFLYTSVTAPDYFWFRSLFHIESHMIATDGPYLVIVLPPPPVELRSLAHAPIQRLFFEKESP